MKKDGKRKMISGAISIIGLIFLTTVSGFSDTVDTTSRQVTVQLNNHSLTESDTIWVDREGLSDDDMEQILQRRHENNVSAYQNVKKKYRHSKFGQGDTVLVQKLAGQHGLSLKIGFLIISKLYMEESLQAESRKGISFGVALDHFISENVEYGVNLTYNYFPQCIYFWGSTRTWSLLEMGAHLKYIKSLSSKISLYGKFGVKMASLNGSRRPGKGIFGGVSGSYQKTRIAYAPGTELAIGLIIKRLKNKIVFLEIGYSCLYMNGKNVKVNGKAAEWSYPFDVKSYGIRVGGLIPFGGKQ